MYNLETEGGTMVRLGDKWNIKKWEKEMEPEWEALGEMMLKSHQELAMSEVLKDIAHAETGEAL